MADILVVFLPFRDVDEILPDLFGCEAFDEDLVGDVVVSGTGEVLLGPDDVGRHVVSISQKYFD